MGKVIKILVVLIALVGIAGGVLYFSGIIKMPTKIKIYTEVECRETAKTWITKLGTKYSESMLTENKDGVYTFKADEYSISIDSKTNQIASYISSEEKFKTQTSTVESLLEISNEIVKKLEIKDYKVTGVGTDKSKLAFISLTKVKEDKLIPGERIKILFEIPTKKIIKIETNNAVYANNKLKITTNEVTEIAETYKTKYSAGSYVVEKRIFEVSKTESRMQYECVFDTNKIIHIDCTTGKVEEIK